MKLSDITSPADLRGLSNQELEALAEDIRAAIIRTVAQNGGHLASNLGVVELTLALHRALDCPRDQIVFDVGHQCYAHKILTGRYSRFSSLRTLDGLCGFPRREESEYDAYDTGHASTAISAAVGLARARDLAGGSQRVVAVVGDGALTGGMCYEALNDVGSRKTAMMIVLNDNGMSISRNVGALSAQLTRLRVSRGWLGMKKNISGVLRRLPGGTVIHRAIQGTKNHLRSLLVRERFFTALGFRYFGPIDGHDIQAMERVFLRLKDLDEPVVVHVATRKGAGFSQAEEKPEKYHGVAPFIMDNGKTRGSDGPSMGKLAGTYVTELAEKDPRICVVTAAMTDSTGFGAFARQYPQRLFDVGIAEEHAVTLCAGMAAGGMRPFAAIYESFLQRAYDQITEDVCLQKLPVCLLMDRAGLGGEDGATHHGLFGVGMLRGIPHMTVLAPRCPEETRGMIDWFLTQEGPAAIRYPRCVPETEQPYAGFSLGRWETLRAGKDGAILAYSVILTECLAAAEMLETNGLSLSVINASTVWPLDMDTLRRLDQKGTPVITVEEHALSCGFGSAVAECCAREGLRPPIRMLGLPNEFIPHGSRGELLRRYGLDKESIARQVEGAIKK
ncbi:MAG: 1-deoxy-D-xylulose-5-phosphate synthase [Clostridia bacterium]|nr:1-deoxy-D-xylulose-5-phosphate synthase [Clostridia bacterium]